MAKTVPDILKQRFDFVKGALRKHHMDENPISQLAVWLSDAEKCGNAIPNAMVLSTAGRDQTPNCRIMLLRDLSHGGLTFFTNYESGKGSQLGENPRAGALFFWPELERQVRVNGSVKKLPEADSDSYFCERPFESRVGAWVSKQSLPVENRDVLDARFQSALAAYVGLEVPRPAWWGGYVLLPDLFEFWQGRKNRMHDRLRYRINANKWVIERLMP